MSILRLMIKSRHMTREVSEFFELMNHQADGDDSKMEGTSSDSLQMILGYLNVKEIWKVCHTSHHVNRVCRLESFWKSKLLIEYGLTKKKDNTWRDSVKKAYINNMFWSNATCNIYKYIYMNIDVDKSEKGLFKLALLEQKELHAFKFIFDSLFQEWYYVVYNVNDSFCNNFFPLFEKMAINEKISMKKLLYTGGGSDNINEGAIKQRLAVLAAIYIKHSDLFLDDICSVEWRAQLRRLKNMRDG